MSKMADKIVMSGNALRVPRGVFLGVLPLQFTDASGLGVWIWMDGATRVRYTSTCGLDAAPKPRFGHPRCCCRRLGDGAFVREGSSYACCGRLIRDLQVYPAFFLSSFLYH